MMDEHLNQVSEETGVPADLLERAARARAQSQGVAVDALVAGWAGGEAPTSAPAAPAEAAPAEVPAAPTEPPPADVASDAPASGGAGKLPEALLRRSAAAKAKREGRPLDEVLVEMGLSPEGATGEAPAEAPARAPAPAAETPPAAGDQPPEEEPEPEPQPVFAGFPRWLAAAFIVIPMVALLYAGFAPNGPDCGTSGQLAINPVSGEAESCDGGGSPFFSLGQSVYEAQCVSCHSADGSGGVGPAFTGGAVLNTFAACSDHVNWVTIGSNNWPDPTYGDTGKPVLGTGVAMPGYEGNLSAEEIASVALYERVAFGGGDPIEEEAACGLGEPTGG